MIPGRAHGFLFILLTFFLSVSFFCEAGYAVPSFKRQTGMSCTTCHTSFPELTPFGRIFKLNGYTYSIEDPSKWTPPLAAAVKVSYTALASNDGILKSGIAPFDKPDDAQRDKANLPQEADFYLAGRLADRIGIFSDIAYDGLGNDLALDLTDIRFSDTALLGGHHVVYGLTVNNSPTMEDIWNTAPDWGFPYSGSDVAPAPAAGTLIEGGLDQQVGGIGGYAAYVVNNTMIYAQGAAYRTANDGLARPLSAGTDVGVVVDNAAPYWRVAFQQQVENHYFELGGYGLSASIFPNGGTSGPTDKFTDNAVDAEYQYFHEKHIFSAAMTWIHEHQEWDASYPAGDASNRTDTLKSFKINANYHYRAHCGTIGGNIAYFAITGDNDAGLYAPSPVNGSRKGSPDSSGFILQADYVMNHTYKFVAQYTIYDRFNGANSNYDGYGRDAKDNNTLYLLLWMMF